MVATDGQKLTLGDTTLTLYITPGHTLGTISTLIPVTDGGAPHLAPNGAAPCSTGRGTVPAISRRSGRTGSGSKPTASRRERFRGHPAKAGADVLISNHTNFDGSKTKLPALATRKPGDPNPYVIGNDSVKRYMAMVDECAQAGLERAK